jgi:hypothetical protein
MGCGAAGLSPGPPSPPLEPKRGAHGIHRDTAVDATGDTCWFWTPEAEGALDMQALRRDDPADLN